LSPHELLAPSANAGKDLYRPLYKEPSHFRKLYDNTCFPDPLPFPKEKRVRTRKLKNELG